MSEGIYRLRVEERCGMKSKVGLVQINNSFSGQSYLPLSVGFLQAYAELSLTVRERFEFQLPIYKRVRVEHAVSLLQYTDIVLFSVYAWNIRLSLEIARQVKEQHPRCLIVFGGPEVPDRCSDFLLSHRFIDLVCHGEGEQVTLQVLEKFEARDWSTVPSVSFVDQDGSVVTNPKVTRLKSLAEIPSPYLKDVFEPLMLANPDEHWIVLWETNRGCPFSCTFCDWGSAIQTKVTTFEMDRLLSEMDWFADHHIEFVFVADANFGILPRDLEIAEYVAAKKRAVGYPHAFSVQNTKNATERAYRISKILSDGRLSKGVNLALQSLDPVTLKSVKRDNISVESYGELQRRFTRDGIETYTDLIIGLPGETYESFEDSVSEVIGNGQHNRIQFQNLSVLPNAEMADPEYMKRYGLQTVESTINNVHGAPSVEEVEEKQFLVIASDAMPREDWVRTRAFAWMTAFLHFDKIFQIPLVVLQSISSLPYRTFLEAFMSDSARKLPTIGGLVSFFEEKARDIQQGGSEYCLGIDWLPISWPADEYNFIRLCFDDTLADFYREAEILLSDLFHEHGVNLSPDILRDAILLNRSLIKRPFMDGSVEVKLSYNIWECYRGVLRGEDTDLLKKESMYLIDRSTERWVSWDEWCREVVWYGHRRGAYFYGNQAVHTEISGHH